MKKILILLIILCPKLTYGAVNDTMVSLINAPSGIYYYKKYLNGTVAQQPASIKVINNQFYAFCLETGIAISKDAYSSNNLFTPVNVNFTKEEIKLMQKYAAFGYEFPGHNNLNYYLATQELIWRVRPSFSNFKWLKNNNINTVHDITFEKNEINRLIQEFDKGIDLPNKIEGAIGSKIILTDNNKALNHYQVTSDNATTENNKLIFNLEKPIDQIILTTKEEITKPSIFYTKQKFQTLGKLYLPEIKTFTININAWYTANISIYTMDQKYKKLITDEIEYTLFDDKMNEIKSLISNKGNLNIPLNEGTYFLKQKKINEQYFLNNKTYKLIVDENNNGDIDLLIENIPIENGKLSINTYDSINLKPIEGITYNILHNNTVFFSGNANDIQKLNLPLGSYELKINKIPPGYMVNEQKYIFNILKNNDLVVIDIMLDPIIKLPQTYRQEVNNIDYNKIIICLFSFILFTSITKLYYDYQNKQ